MGRSHKQPKAVVADETPKVPSAPSGTVGTSKLQKTATQALIQGVLLNNAERLALLHHLWGKWLPRAGR